jgi:hypothetical protein
VVMAKKLSIRIRASLQRCRNRRRNNCAFRRWGQESENARKFFSVFPVLSTKKFGPPQFVHNRAWIFCCGVFVPGAKYRQCKREMSWALGIAVERAFPAVLEGELPEGFLKMRHRALGIPWRCGLLVSPPALEGLSRQLEQSLRVTGMRAQVRRSGT